MKSVNLLPDQHRRGPRPGGLANGAYIIVGLLAVLLVMAVAYTLTSNQVNSRRSAEAAAKQEADTTEARAAALGGFGGFAQIKATRSASVQQLASGRFDWERFLREIAAVLPDGAWLQDTSASTTGDLGSTGTGTTTTTTTAAKGPAQPTAALTGCTPRQTDVADLMVRLRKLYLVDDVELKSAERGEGGGLASVDNCGRYLKFDLRVTFSSATPSRREAPAGHRAVPARLGGGS